MKYYQELTLLPSYDVPLSFIWSKVYQQLHLGFVEQQDDSGNVPYGISFPQYQYDKKKIGLGEKIRVFANSEEELVKLGLKKWLERFTDYVHITGIRAVPEKVVGYAIYQRVRQENSVDSKARRFLLRHKERNMNYDETVVMFSTEKKRVCSFPYLKQKSLTNNNLFRLYVEKVACPKERYNGFGTYGLSPISTVPEF
jgi:CRISPR-associated endonuclease Csy4